MPSVKYFLFLLLLTSCVEKQDKFQSNENLKLGKANMGIRIAIESIESDTLGLHDVFVSITPKHNYNSISILLSQTDGIEVIDKNFPLVAHSPIKNKTLKIQFQVNATEKTGRLTIVAKGKTGSKTIGGVGYHTILTPDFGRNLASEEQPAVQETKLRRYRLEGENQKIMQ